MTIHVCICVLTHILYLMLYVYLCGNDYESASNDTCFMVFHTSRTGRLFTIYLLEFHSQGFPDLKKKILI